MRIYSVKVIGSKEYAYSVRGKTVVLHWIRSATDRVKVIL